MKKIIFAAVALFCFLLFNNADAQVRVSVGFNINNQPEWGPVGYNNVSYYYIPDVDAYYDVNAHQYIYLSGNNWVHMRYLPERYRNYDLYHGYKAVINDRDPWLRHREYHDRYFSYRGRRDQQFIRDSHDERYRNHWRERAEDRRQHYQDTRSERLDRREQHLDDQARRERERNRRQNERTHRQDEKAHDHN